MARDIKNKYIFINILKILSPVLFALFILLANIISSDKNLEGTYTILNNEDYISSFVRDTALARDNITCALFMYKIDDYNMNNLQEPMPLITASLINAAKRGVNENLMMKMIYQINIIKRLPNIYKSIILMYYLIMKAESFMQKYA